MLIEKWDWNADWTRRRRKAAAGLALRATAIQLIGIELCHSRLFCVAVRRFQNRGDFGRRLISPYCNKVLSADWFKHSLSPDRIDHDLTPKQRFIFVVSFGTVRLSIHLSILPSCPVWLPSVSRKANHHSGKHFPHRCHFWEFFREQLRLNPLHQGDFIDDNLFPIKRRCSLRHILLRAWTNPTNACRSIAEKSLAFGELVLKRNSFFPPTPVPWIISSVVIHPIYYPTGEGGESYLQSGSLPYSVGVRSTMSEIRGATKLKFIFHAKWVSFFFSFAELEEDASVVAFWTMYVIQVKKERDAFWMGSQGGWQTLALEDACCEGFCQKGRTVCD